MSCPEFEDLVNFADAQIPVEEISPVEKHLAGGCASCEAALSWYRDFAATASSDRSVEPPAWVTRRAVGLFEDAKRAASERGVRGLLARIRAALVFDSFGGSFAADAIPARSAAIGTRQLLYSASPYDVDLLLSQGDAASQISVTGQVLSPDGEDLDDLGGLTVTLERDGETAATTTTSEFGEFSFGAVRPAIYDLRISGSGREILLSDAPLAID